MYASNLQFVTLSWLALTRTNPRTFFEARICIIDDTLMAAGQLQPKGYHHPYSTGKGLCDWHMRVL
jgi:hypothetical protein